MIELIQERKEDIPKSISRYGIKKNEVEDSN